MKRNGAEPINYETTKGDIFLVSKDGEVTTVNQLRIMPDSVSEKEILRLAKRVVERTTNTEEAEP
ncbi:hypothetical protein RSSM_03936 [Rhodopirellula sallentina SM41]|uniref:Uncharacterized protein n=1 Tax=Rhodopirellula sallentina SM41 TaxID=1263870 RepID=M5U009_9BACT|nr:hypothetical protein RSSM_03936 [Rhodopirellula sallentina SM41]